MSAGATRGDPGALDALLAEPGSTAVLTDFDGTLAPIVPDPATAEPLPDATEVLEMLSRSFQVVGVVSGRPAGFLAEKLGAAGPAVTLVGAYGCEWIEDGNLRRAPETEPWLDAVRRTVDAALEQSPEGAGIEDKGVSVTLHWRLAPETSQWAEGFARTWAQRTGLLVQRGRMAIEMRPPVTIDKGTVVERLALGSGAACFAGDDEGDLAAFYALDRLASRGVLTVRIAVADEESPAELVDRADVVVTGPREAIDWLRILAEGASGARSR